MLVLLLARPSPGSTRRLLLAGTVWTAIVFAGMSLWEFGSTGFLFEYGYYFSAFLVPTLFTLAAVVAVMLESRTGVRPWAPAIVVLSAAGILATGLWIYRSDSPDRIASALTDRAYLTALVAMGLTLALVAHLGCIADPLCSRCSRSHWPSSPSRTRRRRATARPPLPTREPGRCTRSAHN